MKLNLRQCYLLKKRNFLPLFLTQFCGAFNDNAFKLSILTLISYHLSCSQAQSEYYQVLAGALFILPFFLFSATAGQLADRYDKALLTRWIKCFELLFMIIGAFAMLWNNVFLMMIVLTGMGLHSTFFGPIKYAILPDHLLREELLPATALIEASTFMAILLGTTFGALTIGHMIVHTQHSIMMTNTPAVIGLIASFFIPQAPPARSNALCVDLNILRATKQMLQSTMSNRRLLPVVLAISWFWLIGAIILTKLPDYAHYVLRSSPSIFALLLALFSIGIASGSLTISHLLKGRITLRYVPFPMLLFSVFIIDLYYATPMYEANHVQWSLLPFLLSFAHWRIIADFFMFSFSAGLFIVPLYTYLQVCSQDSERARVIAANNMINALAMVIGSLMVMVMLQLHLSIVFVFFILAILNVVVAILFLFGFRHSNYHHTQNMHLGS